MPKGLKKFIFGGDTGTSHEQLRRDRALADILNKNSSGTPRSLGEGLTAIGNALAFRNVNSRANETEERGTTAANAAADRLIGVGFGSSPTPAADGGTPSGFPEPVTTSPALSDGDFSADQLTNAIIHQESRGNPNAVSPKGAMGLGQAMPATARDPGFGVAPLKDPFNAKQNRRFTTDYSQAMVKRYPNDLDRALVAYNWGPGNADKWNGDPSTLPAETRDYVKKVRKNLGGKSATPVNIAAAGGAAPASAGSSIDEISTALADPFLKGPRKVMLTQLLKLRMKENDPDTKAEREKTRLEIEKLKRDPLFKQTEIDIKQKRLTNDISDSEADNVRADDKLALEREKFGLQQEKNAREASTFEEKAQLRQSSKTQKAEFLTDQIDRAIELIDGEGFGFPTAGLGAETAGMLPGTDAAAVGNILETIGANTSFDELASMRAQSPTGGALGSITERELDLLKNAQGNLRQSQRPEDLKDNLNHLWNVRMDIIHGPNAGPQRRELSFKQPDEASEWTVEVLE